MMWAEATRWGAAWALAGALLAPAWASTLKACDTPQPAGVRVLMVGNSYSEDHHPAQRLQQVLLATGCFRDSEVVTVIRRGGRLHELDLARLPVAGPWDRVFLQDHSRAFEEGPERAVAAVMRIQAALPAEARAGVVLVETWAGLADPGAHRRIAAHHAQTAAQAHAGVVRVGAAFAEWAASEGGDGLYAQDGRHPSAEGASLYACVLARELVPKLNLRRCVAALEDDFSAPAAASR